MNKAERIKSILQRLPAWSLSTLTVLLILWLTLASKPLGDDSPRLFEGADKVAHAVMFGFLTLMLLLDRVRRNGWRRPPSRTVWASAAGSAMLGIVVEFVQRSMGLGRGFEVADMAADTAGAILCALAWIWLAPRFTD